MPVPRHLARPRRWPWWILAGVLLVLAGRNAGRWLVVDHPQPADVIVSLYGGTWARQETAVAMLRRGLAPRLVFDVDSDASYWNTSDSELARAWIGRQPAAEVARMSACPTAALSTMEEARLITPCLGPGSHRVLLVTSAYHTRRALAVFRRAHPDWVISIMPANEPQYFGVAWWRHREWAKTTSAEWLKLIWWEAVDRWRRG